MPCNADREQCRRWQQFFSRASATQALWRLLLMWSVSFRERSENLSMRLKRLLFISWFSLCLRSHCCLSHQQKLIALVLVIEKKANCCHIGKNEGLRRSGNRQIKKHVYYRRRQATGARRTIWRACNATTILAVRAHHNNSNVRPQSFVSPKIWMFNLEKLVEFVMQLKWT